jgi:hypothetical protein
MKTYGSIVSVGFIYSGKSGLHIYASISTTGLVKRRLFSFFSLVAQKA